MASRDAPLQNLTVGDLLEALRRLQCESPTFGTETLSLSELLRIANRKPPETLKKKARAAFTKPHTIKHNEQEEDGDDEYEDDLEETQPQPSARFPPPYFSKPLPTRPKQCDQYLYNPPHDDNSTDLKALCKGSDGIRDARHPAAANYNSVFGGPHLTDVQRHIEESIPAHALAQRKLLKKSGKLPSTRKAKRYASPRTPSSKGSPRPWPISPLTPDEQKSPSPRGAYTPFSAKKLTLARAHSESPQRTRTRLHKHQARLSAPMFLPHAMSQPPAAFGLEAEADSSTERGRTRLRKDEHPLRELSYRRGEGPPIGRPILQHPILMPTMSLDSASRLVSPGLHSEVKMPSPLVREQKASSAEEEGKAGAQGDGDACGHVGGRSTGGSQR